MARTIKNGFSMKFRLVFTIWISFHVRNWLKKSATGYPEKNGDKRPFDDTALVVGAGIALQLAQFWLGFLALFRQFLLGFA
ncbi:hypothetical protein [Flavihumibacter profundi]|jgi:hypothetical protein|uniref:hypothetical protein n=1 Tax=Flavihumibacter profundi TaxID=2716883 RepID=UPI001CC75B43|nr:hypothetical protein [Flavihumibacter profundi]MBZ5856423.1 hypothetical protein [Flavihumibacter profundi]